VKRVSPRDGQLAIAAMPRGDQSSQWEKRRGTCIIPGVFWIAVDRLARSAAVAGKLGQIGCVEHGHVKVPTIDRRGSCYNSDPDTIAGGLYYAVKTHAFVLRAINTPRTVIDRFVNDEGDHFPTVNFETNNGKIITNRSSSSSAYLSSKLCVRPVQFDDCILCESAVTAIDLQTFLISVWRRGQKLPGANGVGLVRRDIFKDEKRTAMHCPCPRSRTSGESPGPSTTKSNQVAVVLYQGGRLAEVRVARAPVSRGIRTLSVSRLRISHSVRPHEIPDSGIARPSKS